MSEMKTLHHICSSHVPIAVFYISDSEAATHLDDTIPNETHLITIHRGQALKELEDFLFHTLQ